MKAFKKHIVSRRPSFDLYLTKEDMLQHQLVLFLRYQYPNLKFHHSPDYGRRTPFEQFKYKYLGCDAGFPDLLFPELLLIVELKIKPNKPTLEQAIWIAFFKKIGWKAEVCYSFEEAVMVIEGCVEKIKVV